MVIGSRTPPPLALGKVRAHGLLLELTHTDLRFTPEETTSFLKRQDMAASAALQLQQRTEGWPAALQLAAITFGAKGKSGTHWLERFSGSTESVAEYLAQEVLASRPAPAAGVFVALERARRLLCADVRCGAVAEMTAPR